MEVFEAICITDWFVEDREGNRQECRRGQTYTISAPKNGTVMLFSTFWVRAPEEIFAGPISLTEKVKMMRTSSKLATV